MDPMIRDYEIIRDCYLQQMHRRVGDAINAGWQPVGPCQVLFDKSDDEVFYQTMVRYHTPVETELAGNL